MITADRPRLRRDLVWRRMMSEGQDSWIIKDEITHDYMRLDATSGSLAQAMDGTRTIADLLQRAREQNAGLEFDEDYMADLLQDLRQMGYLDDPFQKSALIQARARAERSPFGVEMFQNLFSMPLGTVDPERFLERTYPAVRFMFTPLMVALGITLFVMAGYVVWLNRELVAAGTGNLLLGERHALLGAFCLWLMITTVIIIHELGHGYAVVHHGGKVHKMGFILVFGMPCMFCDTSDTHLFERWQHRVHVALAGTYTELYIAAFATFVWWLTPPAAVLHQLAYNVMLFASVSGIVFNYNPLIKMDGYFVLSDMLEMPNLMEDSYEYVGYLFRRWVLRLPVECPFHGRRRKRILLAFGLASLVYSIVFAALMYLWLRGMLIGHFALLGVLASLTLLAIVLRKPLEPVLKTTRLWALERGLAHGSGRWMLLGLTALAIAAFVWLPLPARRSLVVRLEPARTAALVAPEAMRLTSSTFAAGQRVRAGQVLAQLDADSMVIARGDAEAQREAFRLGGAGAQALGDAARAAMSRAKANGATAVARSFDRRAWRADLRAPFDGVVLSAARPDRVGQRVPPGDTLLEVGDFSSLRASALASEWELAGLRPGVRVSVRLRAEPGHPLRGRVSAIEALPHGSGDPLYRVWVVLDDLASEPRDGLSGRAHVALPWASAAEQCGRVLARFVRADLWV